MALGKTAPSGTNAEASVQIGIVGMTCASCALRIEKGLARLEGVDDVRVNFGTEKATVRFDANAMDPSQIVAKIEDVGYKAITSTMRLRPVEAWSEARAEEAGAIMAAMPGIVAVRFEAAAGLLVAQYLPDTVGVADVRRSLKDRGLVTEDVGQEKDALQEARAHEILGWLRRFVAGAVVSLPLAIGLVSRVAGHPVLMDPWLQWGLATIVQAYVGGFPCCRVGGSTMRRCPIPPRDMRLWAWPSRSPSRAVWCRRPASASPASPAMPIGRTRQSGRWKVKD